MRHDLALWAAAAWLVGAGASRGQTAPFPPELVPTTAPVAAMSPAGVELWPLAASGYYPVLRPEFYAAEMLPNSATRPYVMMPRFNTLSTGSTSFSYGYRTSPYGDYSRYNYWATGPFPGLPRPPIRTESYGCTHRYRDCP